MGHLSPASRWGVIAACIWEVVALTTGLIPTISSASRNRPWLREAIVHGLDLHLKGIL